MNENISENPQYMNPVVGNYRLQSNSPNIDAGQGYSLEPDSSLTDIGKYYFIPLPAVQMQPSALNIDRIEQGTFNYDANFLLINPGDSLLEWNFSYDSELLNIYVDDSSGYVSPGDTIDFRIELNTNTLIPGQYSTQISFNTTDPDNESFEYHINFRISALWSFNVKASLGSLVDNNNILGMDEDANYWLDSDFDVPEPPPAPNNYLQLAFLRTDYGNSINLYSSDIRAHRELYGSDTELWAMKVSTDHIDSSSVTISFDQFSNFPDGFSFYVADNYIFNENDSSYSYQDTTLIDISNQMELNIIDGEAVFAVIVQGIIPPSPIMTFTSPPADTSFSSGSTMNISWTLENEAESFSLSYQYNGFNSGGSIVNNLPAEARDYDWLIPNIYAIDLYITITALGPGDVSGTNTLGPITVISNELMTTINPGWNLFSLQTNNDNPNFSNDLYLYEFSSSDGYSLIEQDMIQTGYGYWGAAFQEMSFVENFNGLNETTVTLSQGWNIVGSGQPFNVDTSSITVIMPYDSTTNTQDTLTFTGAIINGHISSPALYYWDNGSYAVSSYLKRSHGHWLSALTDGIALIIPPVFVEIDSAQSRSTARNALDVNNWGISFNIETSGISDMLTKLGVKEDASAEFDLFYDLPAAPAPPGGNFVQGYFEHPEWSLVTGSKFSTDYISPIQEGNSHTWSLKISGETEDDINLSWDDEITELPENYTITLLVNGTTTQLDMYSVNSLTISSDNLPTELSIVVESSMLGLDDNLMPSAYALHQNYPNPFNPTTKISYDLPEASFVTLSIFDLMGREIRTMINSEQTAGYKSVQWNATNDRNEPVSAGLYLYTIQAGEFRQTRKMVLLK